MQIYRLATTNDTVADVYQRGMRVDRQVYDPRSEQMVARHEYLMPGELPLQHRCGCPWPPHPGDPEWNLAYAEDTYTMTIERGYQKLMGEDAWRLFLVEVQTSPCEACQETALDERTDWAESAEPIGIREALRGEGDHDVH